MTNVINVRDLETEDVEIVERLVERLRKRASERKPGDRIRTDAFKRSAGSWKGLVDADELISNIYSDRLIDTRQEVKF